MLGYGLVATKGKWFVQMDAVRENTGKIEDPSRIIMTRIPEAAPLHRGALGNGAETRA